MSRASYGRRPAKHGKYMPNARGYSAWIKRYAVRRRAFRWAGIDARLAVQMFGTGVFKEGKRFNHGIHERHERRTMKMNRYQIEHCDGPTIIRAQGYDPQLPTLLAMVDPDGDHCDIYIAVGGNLVALTTIYRGKAFAVRGAKFMLKGFLSRTGKHCRARQNRAAKRAKEEEAI